MKLAERNQTAAFDPTRHYSCEQLVAASLQDFELDADIEESLQSWLSASVDVLHGAVQKGRQIYGYSTGFGPHVRDTVPEHSNEEHASGLIDHLLTGTGSATPSFIIDLAISIRLITLTRGYSAVRPHLLQALISLKKYSKELFVPTQGSVGASGDLVPMAHIAAPLIGKGYIKAGTGITEYNGPALGGKLNSRELLACVNGTPYSTAWAAASLVNARKLLDSCEELFGLAYGLLDASREPLDPTLNGVKNHKGQQQSAAAILEHIGKLGYDPKQEGRSLQEPYSLRAAPQILGAVRDELEFSRIHIENEIHSVDDNPVFSSEEDIVRHGANFMGQHVAFACDRINAAITQMCVLAERLLALILDPDYNGSMPLLLQGKSGNSGLAGLQITATAVLAEMRSRAQNHATMSIPTNGDNQDVVSMSSLASRKAFDQTVDASKILGALYIALNQLAVLQNKPNNLSVNWPIVEGVAADRPLWKDLKRVNEHLLVLGADC
jgi:tyrosine ammonia-lyase